MLHPIGIDAARLERWALERKERRQRWMRYDEEWKAERSEERRADIHFLTTHVSKARLRRIFGPSSEADEIREAILEHLMERHT